jgi:hypothetical protein
VLEIFRSHFADQREPSGRPPDGRHPHPHHAQRVVFVVGVVEERRLVGAADGSDDFPADDDPSVERADRPLRQRLGGRNGSRHGEPEPREQTASPDQNEHLIEVRTSNYKSSAIPAGSLRNGIVFHMME